MHLLHACMHIRDEEGHVVDELPGTVKACTLSSPSASKENGSFTSFLNSLAPLKDKRQSTPPPASCLASITWTTSGSAFSLRHRETHSEMMGKKRLQPPLWTSCLGPLLLCTFRGFASFLRHPHNIHAKKKEKKADEKPIGFVHVCAGTSICVCVCDSGLEGMCYTSGVRVPHSSQADIKLRR